MKNVHRDRSDAAMILKGQTAVISGAAGKRGIGLATARLFAEHGARVAILDIDGKAAIEAASSLGKDHIGLVRDVAKLDQCKAAVDATI
jgi:NAD(P)-dependent dehydrogenase (short-subunit alcohol dehydrogenase family)